MRPAEVVPAAAHEDVVAPVPSSGFRGYLKDANLHDLLQVESLGRASGVFSVRSRGRVGHLHLSDGALVHAECGDLSGEPAALEILAWKEGEFRNVRSGCTEHRTIETSIQALLLRLAKSSDEAARSGLPPPLVPLPASSPPPMPEPPSNDSETEVELSATGEVTSGQGPGVEVLSGRVAYAARLVELIGRALRSGKPVRAELVGEATCTSIEWSPDRSLSGRLGPSGKGW